MRRPLAAAHVEGILREALCIVTPDVFNPHPSAARSRRPSLHVRLRLFGTDRVRARRLGIARALTASATLLRSLAAFLRDHPALAVGHGAPLREHRSFKSRLKKRALNFCRTFQLRPHAMTR
jgi:hypothetical protein